MKIAYVEAISNAAIFVGFILLVGIGLRNLINNEELSLLGITGLILGPAALTIGGYLRILVNRKKKATKNLR